MTKPKRKTKQDKLDQEARTRIIASLNDFFSDLNEISNETGYDIPDLHYNSLSVLHRELCDQSEKHNA